MSVPVHTIADGVLTIDPDGTVLDFNPACEALFGHAADDVIGRSVNMLMPRDFRAKLDDYLRSYRDNGISRISGIGHQITGLRQDGTTFPMEISVGEIGNGHGRAFIGVVRDISRRLRLEQDLRDSDALHRAVVDTAINGIAIIDDDGIVQVFNPSGERMFGHTADEVVGRNISMLMPAPHAAKHDAHMRRYARTGERRIIGIGREVRGRRKDGTTFPLDLSVGEALAGDRRVFVGILRDISRQKAYEEALERSQADLSARVDEVTRLAEEAGSAREEAEAASQMKSEFLAAMSHEIRTPMSGVLGMVDALEASGLTAEQARMATIIRQAGEDLVAILSNILDLSKIEAGRMKLEPERVALSDILDHARDLWGPRLRSKGLAFRVEDGGCGGEIVEVDARRLKQILSNLIGNAWKFTDTGEIVLSVSVAERDADRMILRFSVRDSGIGIAKAQQNELFRPYSQISAMRNRRQGGTGLGLSIARKLAEAMGGEIGVESRKGDGATFWFTVAARHVAAATGRKALAPPAAAQCPRHAGLRVLVAEDNRTNQKVIGTLLHLAQIHTRIVDNGAEAFAAMQEEDFDLVLMDHQMPEMDGPEATRAIRAMAPPKGAVPIIAVTANSMKGDRERYLSAGMNDYISKPVNMSALIDMVEKWAPPPA